MDSIQGAPLSESRSPITEIIRTVVPIIIFLLGVAGFLVLSFRKQTPTARPPEKQGAVVETVSVQPHDKGLDIEVSGLVVPFREIELSAEIAGKITYKADVCRAGNYVAAETLLIEIDPRDYDLEVRRLMKELEQADNSLAELDVESASTQELLKLAAERLALERNELDRQVRLGRVVSESDLDRAKQSELTARNNELTLRNQQRLLNTRRSRLEQAKELVSVQLEKAQLDQRRTKIVAPVDGVIVREWLEQDAYVQKGAGLVTIEDTSAAEVKCNLRMEELNWLWRQASADFSVTSATVPGHDYQLPQTPVTVTYRLAGRDFAWNGVLARFDGIRLDEQTRTVPCRVVVPNPRDMRIVDASADAEPAIGPPALVRGMYVTVKVHAKPQTRLLQIPETAVRPGNVVWLMRDGKLDIQPVHVAQVVDRDVIIRADGSRLSAGDKVVVSPLVSAEAGMAVREQAIP
jgi:RND family efflux transporter MFP subunit